MHKLSGNTLLFAISLSALAGCVDSIGFIQLGGYFVSFMSGNSTRFAVALQHEDWISAKILGLIIFSFVIGAAIGSDVKHRVRPDHVTLAILILVTLLLLSAALCEMFNAVFSAMLIVVIAMGIENSALQSNGEVIGVTYMTGTLVKLGQGIANRINGKVAIFLFPYLLLWLGLLTGGIIGSLLFMNYSSNALWFPTGWALILTFLHWKKLIN